MIENKEALDNQIRIEKLFKGTFNTDTGKKCLEHLERTFVDRNIYAPGMSLDQVAFRQGQADIVKQILSEVKR